MTTAREAAAPGKQPRPDKAIDARRRAAAAKVTAVQKAVKTLGSLPLIVLTSRSDHNPPGWQTWQAELPKLSSQGEQLFAEKGGHNIEIDEPEAAVAAIVKMVEKARQ